MILIRFYFKFWTKGSKEFLFLFFISLILSVSLWQYEFELVVYIMPILFANWILTLMYNSDRKSNVNLFFQILEVKNASRIYTKFSIFYLAVLIQFLIFNSTYNIHQFIAMITIATNAILLFLMRELKIIAINKFVFLAFITPLAMLVLLVLLMIDVKLLFVLLVLELLVLFFNKNLKTNE